jgi:glycine oxidase
MKVLIVGQGIAGTILAWTLRRLGAAVHVTDATTLGRASAAAAGIINPVTGKRYVESWRFADFWPAAQTAYRTLTAELGAAIWHEMPIVRLLPDPGAVNDWELRRSQSPYTDWLGISPDAADWAALVGPHAQCGIIHCAARVDFAALTAAWCIRCQREGLFLDEPVPIAALPDLATGTYDAIVCCEGWRAVDNPFFPGLPWQPAKGEALLIRFPDLAQPPRQMLKHTILIAPVGDGLYWAGANYNWQFADGRPTAAGRAFVEQELATMLSTDYEVVDHVAGIRPAVRDRRPLIGRSSVHSKIFMFNGLGTKGALLAPFWAEHLAQHLLYGHPLAEAVQIARQKLYT